MSDQDDGNDGSLVPAERRELAPVAAVNPLVSRGLADLARSGVHKATLQFLRRFFVTGHSTSREDGTLVIPTCGTFTLDGKECDWSGKEEIAPGSPDHGLWSWLVAQKEHEFVNESDLPELRRRWRLSTGPQPPERPQRSAPPTENRHCST
jgi:hypothetical protein